MEIPNRIVVISETDEGYARVTKWITEAGDYRVRRLTNGQDQWSDVDAAVFDCDVLETPQIARLQRLSMLMSGKRILILAQQISVNAYRQVKTLNGMNALQKPFHESIFQALLRGLFQMSDASVVPLPRFITDEPVRALVLRTGLLIPTRMKNYSAGGAFLEYRGISLKVGDTIQVGLANEARTKKGDPFQLNARVVWIKAGDGPRSPARGIGIQFLEE